MVYQRPFIEIKMENEKIPSLQFYLFESKLYYKGRSIVIEDNILAEFTSKLSPFWWNENDKIVLFTYYEDGTFSCEKQKIVYDYKLQKKVPVLYNFYEVSEKQIAELYDQFSGLYEICRIELLKNSKEQVKQKLFEEFNLIVSNLRGLRSTFLSKSDWTQVADVPLDPEVLYKCPALIDAESAEQVREYLSEWHGAIEVLDEAEEVDSGIDHLLGDDMNRDD